MPLTFLLADISQGKLDINYQSCSEKTKQFVKCSEFIMQEGEDEHSEFLETKMFLFPDVKKC